MNQTNRFHQRARRLSRVRVPDAQIAPGASTTPGADAATSADALAQAAHAITASRFAARHNGFAFTLCCSVLLASGAAFSARAATPLLTDASSASKSRISHSAEKAAAPVAAQLAPRASTPQRAVRKRVDRKRVDHMTMFLPPMTPHPSAMTTKPVAAAVRIIRAARTISTSQQMRLAMNDGPAEQVRVLASYNSAAPAEAAPDLPKMENGQPLRKIINVSALKQLPPASAPLPANLRANAISADRFNSQSTERIAQNPGAAPVRQPTKPVTNSDRLSNQIEVSVGTFVVLLTTSDLDTVAVAEPNTADVAVVNSRAVLVNGKTPGVTSLVVVDKFRIRQYQVRVVAAPGTLPRDISAQIGLPGVGVRQVRDAIVLDGEVNSAEEARRAAEIAGVYSAKVINQITIRDTSTAPNPLAAEIQNAIDLPNVRVRVVGETTILDGTVETAAQRSRAVTLASTMSKNVVNLLELPRLNIAQIEESLKSMTSGEVMDDNDGQVPTSIRARIIGDEIVLEGNVDDPALSQQAAALAGRSGLDVINRVRVSQVPTEDRNFRNAVQEAIGISGVRVAGNKKLIVLHGVVPDTNVSMRAEQIALSYAGEVQNMMQTPNPITVNVDVAIVEINKNSARGLGVQFPNLANGQIIGSVGIGPGTGTNFGATFSATLQALINDNKARLLSHPRMTVSSGRTAGFLVGGQIPIPSGSTTNQNGTTTTIAFKDFGILVNIVPVGNSNGNVTMRIYTSVSQIDNTVGFNLPGSSSTIPGFTLRTATSEVTVPANGTIAIGGLIQNNITRIVQRVPFLSNIPILGSLFKSRSFQRNESELVFFVSPRVLPNPLAPGETAPVTVYSGFDNGGTPGFGTGGVQTGSATGRSVSDGRFGLPPAAAGGNVTAATNTNAPGGASGSNQQ